MDPRHARPSTKMTPRTGRGGDQRLLSAASSCGDDGSACRGLQRLMRVCSKADLASSTRRWCVERLQTNRMTTKLAVKTHQSGTVIHSKVNRQQNGKWRADGGDRWMSQLGTMGARPKTSSAALPEARLLIQPVSRASLASATAKRVLTIDGVSETRPSSSPITRSPGETRHPPMTTGRLTAPWL